MNRPDNVIRIPTSLKDNFFRYWFEFLQPLHKLTNREIDIISALAKERYELSKVIKDNDILDRVTMSDDIKKKVMQNCNITTPHFQVIMSNLKKAKVIEDGKINPRCIPNVTEENGYFQLVLLFDLK